MTLLTNEDFFVSKGEEIEFIYCLFVETKKNIQTKTATIIISPM